MNWRVLNADCLTAMRDFAPGSFDAIVTDPPAGIGFMGKRWDSDKGGRDAWIDWMAGVAAQCLRVLKPGAHALVWSLPRTSHWTATAWENAGFEVRDRLAHIFGQGFPKSLNVSMAIDREERDRWLHLCKLIDNLGTSAILSAWIDHSESVKSAGLRFARNETATGTATPSSDSVPAPALLSIVVTKLPVSAIVAELSSFGVLPMSEGDTITVRTSADGLGLSSLAGYVASRQSMSSSVLSDVRDMPNASILGSLGAVEALMTWLGSKSSSRQADTVALSAALTADLKLIIASQSETFRSLDTTQQMEFASATTVTITESTAASLISFTADTLRRFAIDKTAGAERTEVVGTRHRNVKPFDDENGWNPNNTTGDHNYTAPATPAAAQWQGYGTALKPAVEDWWLLRKPLDGTVAANVLKHGTGGLNIDGCRIGTSSTPLPQSPNPKEPHERSKSPDLCRDDNRRAQGQEQPARRQGHCRGDTKPGHCGCPVGGQFDREDNLRVRSELDNVRESK